MSDGELKVCKDEISTILLFLFFLKWETQPIHYVARKVGQCIITNKYMSKKFQRMYFINSPIYIFYEI
jgi:hypothetical protein